MKKAWIIGGIALVVLLAYADVSGTFSFTGRSTPSSSSTSSVSAVDARKADRLANMSSMSSISSTSSESLAPSESSESFSIPILVYHHIRAQEGWGKNTWSWKMTVTPQTFERHMQWLADKGYTTITLDALVEIAQGKRTKPEKPVVITLDDSNLSQYDVALPILKKHNQVAVFYLITKYLDSSTMINRDRAKELVALGHDVQSHTLTHRAMTPLSDEELDWELKESKRLLEEVTGKPVLHVAYPGTDQNQRVREHAKAAGYVTGTIMDPRYTTQADDWMKWPRIMMTDDSDLTKVLP